MLTLHLYNHSPFNQKIQRMLNIKGVPYESKYWRIAERSQILKISPTGKLPALTHDGKTIVDSTEMAYYIEDTFPETPLVPSDPRQKGLVHALEDWADESLYFYEMTLRFVAERNSERNIPKLIELESAPMRWILTKVLPRVMRKTTAGQGIGRKSHDALCTDTERHIRAVSDMLGDGEWLVGDAITLADLAVYAMFQCFRDADLSRALLEQYPRVQAWMTRIEDSTSTAVSPQ